MPESGQDLVARISVAVAAGDTRATCDLVAAALSAMGDAGEARRWLEALLADAPSPDRTLLTSCLLQWLGRDHDAALGAAVAHAAFAAADPDQREQAALLTLEHLAMADDDGVPLAAVSDEDWLALLTAMEDPRACEAALTYALRAPASTTALVRAWATETGYRHGTDARVLRAAERVLHHVGAREDAYHLARVRKGLAPTPKRTALVQEPPLANAVIVLVGGHDGLRAMLRQDLHDLGAREIRDIPPRWEGNRAARATAVIPGATLVIAIIGELDHSTSDAAKRAAQAAAVPLVVVATLSPTRIIQTAVTATKANTRS